MNHEERKMMRQNTEKIEQNKKRKKSINKHEHTN